MSNLFWLTNEQMARLQPYFPKMPTGVVTLYRRRGHSLHSGSEIRNKTIKYDKRRYKRRNRIEIMFGRLKDWRRVATRCDRCPMAFLSAIALTATVIFWL
jgi:transposase